MGGYAINGSEFEPRYTPRSVSIVDSGEKSRETKKYNIQVIFPERAANRIMQESVWEPLVDEFKRIISANRSTLLFVNSRRLCEKLAFKINSGEIRPIVYAHHGSLSREIRETVEQKFKAGELKGIIATSSLELGIDIGTLDEVLLIQSPFSISSAIQKIGRAGHQVGEISRGKLFPTHPRSFIEAAALTRGIIDQDIEAVKPIQCPLDVLAQIIISMTGVEKWNIDTLFNQVKTSYPYRKLNRKQFDLVLNMLAGRYADSRIRELNPRISIDSIDKTVAAKKGALLALYMSGGTIPDRGYYRLRHYKTNAIIGELDEEFVWEARIGQTFNLGTQSWRIDRITHNDVFALPGSRNVTGPPFWKAEAYNRDFHFSERIGSFLQYADKRLDYPDFAESLQQERGMDAIAVQQLIDFLKRQKHKTDCSLPHRHHLLIEFVNVGPGGAPGNQVVLHTLWGGRVNRPFAMALEEAWEERYKHTIEVNASNDCVLLLLPHKVDAIEILSLVTCSTVESLLKKRLEKTGFFGARFRECAGRSLLLTKKKVTQRVPLWLSRLQSKKLMDSVLQYEDFPILIETWRTCLQDEFDLDNLKTVLTDLESGSTAWTEIHNDYPSPMAQSESWQQLNQYMYMDDTPQAGKTSMLRSDLLQDLVFTPDLRPTVSRELVEIFELKRKRLYQG